MVKKSYLYLGEQNIGIEGPSELLKRVDRNFEEELTEGISTIGKVKIEEGKYVKFNRDRSKPYLGTRINNSKNYQGIDFLRYGVCVRTLWKKDPLNYEVKNFLPLDETGSLKCFKKIYYNSNSSKNKALIQGSLVEVDRKGILVLGGCWSGKTSLTLGFLEKLNGRFVSDGNTLISFNNKRLVGYYLPRPVFVRFASINSSENLSEILINPWATEAIQPFDKEAIEKTISKREYGLDAGLNISRKKFVELMGIETTPLKRIDKIIHTQFDDGQLPKISPINLKGFYKLLLAREFPKNTSIGNIQHQREIRCPFDSIIRQNWLEEVEKVGVSFDARKNLTKSLLEDLV